MTTSVLTRAFYAVPVIGWIARDTARHGEENLYYGLVILLTLLVLAVKTWGLVALGLTGVFFTPVMLVILIRITLG